MRLTYFTQTNPIHWAFRSVDKVSGSSARKFIPGWIRLSTQQVESDALQVAYLTMARLLGLAADGRRKRF